MTGRWRQARAEFAKAVDIDPVNHYAHFALGLACARTGDRVQAVAHLKLAVAMEPLEQYRAARSRTTTAWWGWPVARNSLPLANS